MVNGLGYGFRVVVCKGAHTIRISGLLLCMEKDITINLVFSIE